MLLLLFLCHPDIFHVTASTGEVLVTDALLQALLLRGTRKGQLTLWLEHGLESEETEEETGNLAHPSLAAEHQEGSRDKGCKTEALATGKAAEEVTKTTDEAAEAVEDAATLTHHHVTLHVCDILVATAKEPLEIGRAHV